MKISIHKVYGSNNFARKDAKLSAFEQEKIIYDWNATNKAYPDDQTIQQLFEAQVAKTPQNTALIYENLEISYQSLNERANQLAHYLKINFIIKNDDLIVVFLDRSEYLLISILAILKSGGAWVPIDPTYPDSRISYILQNTQAKAVLTTTQHMSKLLSMCDSDKVISIDDSSMQSVLSAQPIANPQNITTTDNLAYVIYTSGTTGKPKGVMLEHGGIVNRIHWMNQEYPLNSQDRILQKTPCVFDVSVWELLWAIWYGACIVMAKPEGHKDPNYLIDLMQGAEITICHFVPSMLSIFTEALQNRETNPLTTLRYIFASGEVLRLDQAKLCRQLLPHVALFNLYGPTEASIDVLSFSCNAEPLEAVLIGKPIDNCQVYVLDEQLHPVPIGVEGELYLAGVNLARGYLNQPELTQERFIRHPLLNNRNNRLYKTGDLVVWRSDGNLDYKGRNDFQVKIRGNRIELGEIEYVLSQYLHIKHVVVVAETHQTDLQLVAYYVSTDELIIADLLKYLISQLPEYMIPSKFLRISALPVTINGKLERSRLSSMCLASKQRTIIPARMHTEQLMIDIWSKEFGIVDIGIDDNFFELGGHSLIAARIITQIQQVFNKTILLQDLYSLATIAKIHDLLMQTNTTLIEQENLPVAQNSKWLRLSDFQFMLWISYLFDPNAKNLNVILRKRMQGKLDIQALSAAFNMVIGKHEVLLYQMATILPAQALNKKFKFNLQQKTLYCMQQSDCEAILLESSNELMQCKTWHKHHPLILARLFLMDNDYLELQVSMSHMIADEMSLEIFFDDLSKYYLLDNRVKNTLDLHHHPAKAVQSKTFNDYIDNEHRLVNRSIHEKRHFWESYLQDAYLFEFAPGQIIQNMDIQRIPYSTYVRLSKSIVEIMHKFCSSYRVTLNEMICAVLAKTLEEFSPETYNNQPIYMNIVKSARDSHEYERTIGCLVRLESIKVSPKNNSLLNLVQTIHQFMLDSYSYQQCPILLRFACLKTLQVKHKNFYTKFMTLGLGIYARIMHLLRLNYSVLNSLANLVSLDRENKFVININVWNNFLVNDKEKSQDKLFSLPIKSIEFFQYDILRLDNLVEFCFMREEHSKEYYLVVSGNLEPSVREAIAKKLIDLIENDIRLLVSSCW